MEDKERRDVVDERHCGSKVGERKKGMIEDKKRHGMGWGEMGGGRHKERETYI